MINFAVLLASVVLVSTQTIGPGVPDPRCPPGTPNPPLHFGDPNDCTIFHTCVNGLLTPQACPPGQHWSVRNNFCDWPDRAECEAGSTECPPDNDFPPVLLPFPDDCTRFFKCSWGIPVEMSCPPGQHWWQEQQRCDWPDRANCEGGNGDSGSSTRSSKETEEEEF